MMGRAHLCIGCNCLNDGLWGARDVGKVELCAASLLHAAAHQQLVVATVHCQHLQDVEHEEKEKYEEKHEDEAMNEEKHEERLLHLVEVVSANQ